jgi:Protein of Unknown function (DUF2784)
MWYRAAADLVMVIHLLFIGFVVGGVFFAWRWRRLDCAPARVGKRVVPGVGELVQCALLARIRRSGNVRAAVPDRRRLVVRAIDARSAGGVRPGRAA